jgi:hypothetical protein
MVVGAEPIPAGRRPAGAASRPAKRAAWIAIGSLAVTFADLAWARAGRGAAAIPADLAKAGTPAGPERTASSPQTYGPVSGNDARPADPSAPSVAAASQANPMHAGLKAAGMRAGARTVSAAPRRPRPPAVAISGPAGTRVSVDDTAEWVSPGPKGGWAVAPGLVNITLKPPGSGRAITSSLFVSEDTLYVLSLDAEGGFSVSRRRR